MVLPVPALDCGPERVPLPEIFPRRTVFPALRGCSVPLTAKVGLSEPKVLPLLFGEKRSVPPDRMLIVPVKLSNCAVVVPPKLTPLERFSTLLLLPELRLPLRLFARPGEEIVPVWLAGTMTAPG